jgi:hypothetical protein
MSVEAIQPYDGFLAVIADECVADAVPGFSNARSDVFYLECLCWTYLVAMQ